MTPTLPANRRRAGVTLVELLAVCAIIVILTAMGLPALMQGIGRSRITQCFNNQSLLASALLHYNEQNGRIPGWLNDSTSGTACSWTVPLLPFIGRSDVSEMWLQKLGSDAKGFPTIEAFVCPSNPPGRVILKSPPWASPASPLEYSVVHYAANAGAGALQDVTTSGTDKGDGAFKNLKSFWNGTKWERRAMPVSLDMIAEGDGTSSTLAFMEKSAFKSQNFPAHAWAYTFSGTGAPQDPFGIGPFFPPICGLATPPGPVKDVINNAGLRNFAPSSFHRGGVVVAFCDGRTAFLKNDLQPYEYAQLLTWRTRWGPAPARQNLTNTSPMHQWLLKDGLPYLLDDQVLRR